MGMQTIWLAGTVAWGLVLLASPVTAAEAFVEVATSGIEADAEQRRPHRGVEVDWVRRVRVNPAALQAQEISIDLYDTTLQLVRDTRDLPARSHGEWLYSIDDGGSPQRQRNALPVAAWAGTVHGSTGMAGSVGAQGVQVKIWASPHGFSAEFRLGKMRYELNGDVLVKRDMRRFRVNENNDVRDVRPDRPTPMPLIHHNGQPTGTADIHDNARVLRETKAIIAGFYPDLLP